MLLLRLRLKNPTRNKNFHMMKILNLVLVLGVIVFFIFIFVKDRYYKPDELRENGILLSASTLEWEQSSKMGFGLKYEFFYNGEKITGYAAAFSLKGNINFTRKNFPPPWFVTPRTIRTFIECHSALVRVPTNHSYIYRMPLTKAAISALVRVPTNHSYIYSMPRTKAVSLEPRCGASYKYTKF